MKFSVVFLLSPVKKHLLPRTAPFTVCQYLFWLQKYEGLKLSANSEKETADSAKIMTSQV